MNADLPLFEPNADASYPLEVVARFTGISSQTILHYQEQGLIRDTDLDDDAVRALRRIEHLRSSYETNVSGLKLIMDLIDQVERLQADLRARR